MSIFISIDIPRHRGINSRGQTSAAPQYYGKTEKDYGSQHFPNTLKKETILFSLCLSLPAPFPFTPLPRLQRKKVYSGLTHLGHTDPYVQYWLQLFLSQLSLKK